ncbi:uncharacterized protein EV154DRAFT_511839 [Mucor mucedo]|uniref:uncharacterized protein n=1 Tax=Mucor mucedo TaxID=29922 RepID=UPI00221FB858|nr:uncharacterized protein EV154DRAFT_511839 [Mucor mucedo]KAI7890353.1 hypothetical protein EV154DRAFT_511839 [Mucor mucedo]
MSQIPLTPTSLASPTPLNTLIYMQADGLVSPTKEDISTIFVVGFPEDMQEREFQNMFMFSPGFEAATLKVPNGKDEEDCLMNNGRKQIIGFAKFRTRKEAMDARDILNGRKVDSEKNSLLKAEMAKKNLHTKRGLNEQQRTTAYEAFYSVPQSLQSPNEFDFYESTFISRSQSVDAKQPPSLPTRFHSNFHQDYLSKSTPAETPFIFNNTHNNSTNNHNNNSISSHINSPTATTSTGLSRVMEELFIHQSMSTPLTSPLSPTTSYRSLGGMLVGSSNPADQNPPCNTLYVGNLPPNTNEDELKSMFYKCPGYKRLSFRNKSNGPMCFVEFEDAIYAAQALQDLHGNPLSNSVKGGIRLSFSKNPLGVRQNNTNNTPYPIMFNRRSSITTNFDPQLS